jgi:hypothetical protein
VYIKDTSGLQFKVEPVSAGAVNVLFYNPGSTRNLVTLYLKKDTATVGTYDVSNNGNGLFAAAITYNFDTAAKYNFVVLTNTVNDTIYRYTISQYAHVYSNSYSYQNMAPLVNSTTIIDLDITPSRNYLFIEDDSINSILTKRVSLQTGWVDYVSAQYSHHLRALSDTVLLLEATYNNYIPTAGSDSTAFVSYNINSGNTALVSWVSSNYGRTSRIVNNHILVTNPVFTSSNFTLSGTEALINLADATQVTYSQSAVDFRYIGEDNYDNIYYKNQVVDTQTGAFEPEVPAADSSNVEYVDKASGYTVASYYKQSPPNGATIYYTSRLRVYSQFNKVYESDSVAGREFYIPKLLDIHNGVILFYQYFGYGTTFNIDGYYTLDMATKKISLVQPDDNPGTDFQLDATHIISVRKDGIYKLTKQ